MKSKIQVGAEVTRLKLKQQQSLLTSAPTVLRTIVMAGLWTGMLAHADTAFMSANANGDTDVAAVYDRRSADLALTLDAAAPVAVPDSIVQLTADAQGLALVPSAQVPRAGTFWLVQPGLSHVVAPMPCPPDDLSLPIYAIGPDGQFLVDGTVADAAVVAPSPVGRLATTTRMEVTLETALEQQANAVLDLISQVQTAAAPTSLRTMSMSVSGVPGFGDTGSGTNTVTYNANSYSAPDYGTNLWVAPVGITNGSLALIASNTIPAVQYLIQSRTNLLQTDWQAEFPILGSETTNWTPFSVPQNNRTNLFLRLQSWISSDGSGLPDWWQLLYFGQLGVDPYGNPAGDGWSNLQKFQNGWNPNQFYTPAAPQGLQVQLHQTSQTAGLSWLPSAGNVVSYTVEKSYQTNYLSPIVTSSFTTTNLNYTDSLAGNTPDPWSGDAYLISYRVKANYATGGSSYLAAPAALQPATVSGASVTGTNGEVYLVVAGLPPNAAAVRLTLEFHDYNYSTSSETVSTTHHDIPVSAFTNGRYVIPSSWQAAVTDANGNVNFYAKVSSVDASGNPSAATGITGEWGATMFYYLAEGWQTPFYDGRIQMKQNLIFQLRLANAERPCGFTSFKYDPYLGFTGLMTVTNPAAYVYAGFYDINNTNLMYGEAWDLPGLNIYRPFEDNYLYENFVFNAANADGDGQMLTGVQYPSFLNEPDDLALAQPPAYLPTTNAVAQAPSLNAAATRWLCQFPMDMTAPVWALDYLDRMGLSYASAGDAIVMGLPNNARNYWGLPYLSAKIFHYGLDNNLHQEVLAAGATLTTGWPAAIYMEAAQPQLQTVEYDFWQLSGQYWPEDYLKAHTPGSREFTTTNQSDLMLVGVGQSLHLTAYAKLAVPNGYPGVFAYLGQYLDTAYQVDDTGHATTNTTGIVNPYGYYFATDAGTAALVTMPDLDTGARGTCMVYSVALQLDKNHDGTMDTRFNGDDVTSLNSPFIFWANNNYDRWAKDSDDGVYYEDDVQIGGCPYTPNKPTPDFEYRDNQGNRIIPCTRDLEDFARLWVCGVTTNLLAALPTGSTVTLCWNDVGAPNSGNPTIDLFSAVDPDGSTAYLTDGSTAGQQALASYLGRLGPGQSIQLNSPDFVFHHWAGNHFIWCGVSNGTGGLTLTIADAHSNVLAQTTAYIQIKEIKQMYERWTVGEKPSVAPLNTAHLATDSLPSDAPAFEYPLPQDTNTPYILYVHGWNMETWEKDRFAEAAFKRLYWQGYQGRFGVFRWPTDYKFTGSLWDLATRHRHFDNSEYTAWRAATGLHNKLTDLNTEYPNHVYLLAHSMGNIVAGKAVRLAGTYRLVNTYVASQAAITAHTYDDSLPASIFATSNPKTPNIYNNWFVGNNGGGAGRVINFYNTNDFALQSGRWEFDQTLKPDNGLTVFPGLYLFAGTPYNGDPHYTPGSVDDTPPWQHFGKDTFMDGRTYFNLAVTADRYEVSAYAAQARASALGRTAGVLHLTANVYLGRTTNPRIWPSDTTQHGYGDHFWHSAQFRSDHSQQQGYWNALLGPEAFNLK